MINNIEIPTLINGNLFCDDRGTVKFINDLDLSEFKRFYLVENHSRNFIRAWHGHQHEYKGVVCLKGSALVGAVNMTDGKVNKVTLSSQLPQTYIIPSGYANGFKTLTDDCLLMFLSSSTVEESKTDDIRIKWDKWNIWEESYR
jgi:dTDP-4-dehydrorhamnose 3,5-epimerase-like enzyme